MGLARSGKHKKKKTVFFIAPLIVLLYCSMSNRHLTSIKTLRSATDHWLICLISISTLSYLRKSVLLYCLMSIQHLTLNLSNIKVENDIKTLHSATLAKLLRSSPNYVAAMNRM